MQSFCLAWGLEVCPTPGAGELCGRTWTVLMVTLTLGPTLGPGWAAEWLALGVVPGVPVVS